MRAIHTQSTSNEWGLETWCSEIFLFTDNREEGFSALKGFLVFPTGNLLIVLALIWVYTLYCPSTKHQTAEGSSQDFAGQILSRLDTLGIIKRRLFHQSSDSRQTRKACNCSDVQTIVQTIWAFMNKVCAVRSGGKIDFLSHEIWLKNFISQSFRHG